MAGLAGVEGQRLLVGKVLTADSLRQLQKEVVKHGGFMLEVGA